MEEQVKRLIRKSLHMRLQGMGRIDNIRTNEALIGIRNIHNYSQCAS